MKTIVIIIFFCFSAWFAKGQQRIIDSLKQALSETTTDSLRFSIIKSLSIDYSEDIQDSALKYIEQGIFIAKKNNCKLNEADLLRLKAHILADLEKYPEAFKTIDQAIQIAENPENENKFWRIEKEASKLTPQQFRLNALAWGHHNLGHLMGRTNNSDQEVIHYQKANKLAQQLGDSVLLSRLNLTLGDTYLGLNLLDSALLFYKMAETYLIRHPDNYLGSLLVEIGSVYLKKGKDSLALPYLFEGVNEALKKNTVSGARAGYYHLTGYYLDKNQKDSSLFFAHKTLELTNSTQLNYLGDAYENLYKSYTIRDEFDSAYKYLGLTLITKTKSNEIITRNLSGIQKILFQEQLHLQELEKVQVDTRNKTRIIALLVGLVVFMAIGLILYRNNRQKHAANILLAHQKEKIEKTFSDLKATQSQLIQSEKMASLGELTAGIAHEIQNPLNFVNNFSEVNKELIKEIQDERRKTKDQRDEELENELLNDIKENEEKINHHGKRADAIVKGMLQHSRSSSGIKEPTDINALCDEYLRLSYHGLRAKDKSFNAKFETDFDSTLPKLNVVPQDIGRVILNLINNAFYACTERSRSTFNERLRHFDKLSDQPDKNNVTLSLSKGDIVYEPIVLVSTKNENGKVLITVKDNGNGIPDSIKEKIFQPFFTTKPTGQGTGLGLSLSYDIVKAHGGVIKVDTRETQGTTFLIILPIQ